MNEKICCGLDIGSQRIKASLVKYHKNQYELLGVHESLTRGIKKSMVNNLGELADCIHYCLEGLARKTSYKIKDIELGIGGQMIENRQSRALTPLLDRGTKVISETDIKRVDKQACLLGTNMEEQVLHYFPRNYTVDDNDAVTNPLGVYGRKLGVNLLLIVAKINLLSNITKAVNQAGYDVPRVAFSGLGAAGASLGKKIKAEGCILIDIGSETINVLIFKDGFLRELEVVRLGGDTITEAIVQSLNLPFGVAEEIKKSYAVVLSDDAHYEGEILVKKESDYVPVKREVVCQAIESQVSKIVASIENVMKYSKFYGELPGGVIMVGGGSLLSGLIERIIKVTNLPVRLGQIDIAMNRLNNPAVYSCVVGLAQSHVKKPFHPALSLDTQPSWFGQFSRSVKEWYQEYF